MWSIKHKGIKHATMTLLLTGLTWAKHIMNNSTWTAKAQHNGPAYQSRPEQGRWFRVINQALFVHSLLWGEQKGLEIQACEVGGLNN